MASGVLGSVLYEWLNELLQSTETALEIFCFVAALAMIGAAAAERYFGVEYAKLALEEKAPPLSNAPPLSQVEDLKPAAI